MASGAGVEEKKWELCLGGCGHWLKNKWGVCVGCYKKGHVGRSFECESGFVLCRGGCGVHVKVSTGACKLCVQKIVLSSFEKLYMFTSI